MGDQHYCPLCDTDVAREICPTHHVATVQLSLAGAEDTGLVGTTLLNRYRIDKQISSGGMGSVYLATQLSMARTIAIKVLKSETVVSEHMLKRFYREAYAASQLNHPNIIRMFDFGIDREKRIPFLAMEYLEGRTLKRVLTEDGPLGERRAAELLGQVAKALVAAHEKGIVHRDLKPDNVIVMVLPDGEEHARVLDFGVAKIIGAASGADETPSLTGTGVILGTPYYMGPEQIRGKDIDFRADLYALGCILHELVVGERAFAGTSIASIVASHIDATRPVLPARLPGGSVPSAELVALHRKLLAKEAADRPASTLEVSRTLNKLARGEREASVAPPVQKIEPRPGLAVLDAADTTAIKSAAAPSGMRWIAIASAFVVVFALATLAFIMIDNDEVTAIVAAPVTPRPAPSPKLEAPVPTPPPPPPVREHRRLLSEPPGAEIFTNGVSIGTTPRDVDIPAEVELRLPGREPQKRTLAKSDPAEVRVVFPAPATPPAPREPAAPREPPRETKKPDRRPSGLPELAPR